MTSDWHPILGRPCRFADTHSWSVDWQIAVHYEQPDGLVPDGEGDFYFVDRHIRPEVTLDQAIATRESKGLDESPLGCQVSAAALPKKPDARHGGEIFGDRNGRTAHERDWDFLVETREKNLARTGVSSSASTREKVEALALFFGTKNYIPDKAKDWTKGYHPVDVLLHGQHCTGQSAALAAFCHTMGVRARTLNFAGHSVCEACLDGKYFLFDNQVEEPCAGRSYMETAADPASSLLTEERRQDYHWLMNTGGEQHLTITKGKWPNAVETAPFNHGVQWWRFNSAGLGATYRTLSWEGGHGFTLPLTPETAKALYPAEERYIFKYNAQEPCRASLCLPHTWYAAPLVIQEGMTIRKAFWLGALDGATSVTARLMAWPGQKWQFSRPFKAGWHLEINGRICSLADLARHGMALEFVPWGIRITLPLSWLQEQALNQIAIGAERTGDEYLAVCVYPDLLIPYLPPVRGATARVNEETITGTHVCDRMMAHCPA